MSRHGSVRWIAEQLQARGYDVSHNGVRTQPERVVWEDGQPAVWAAKGYRDPYETRTHLITRMYQRGVLTSEQAAALLGEVSDE